MKTELHAIEKNMMNQKLEIQDLKQQVQFLFIIELKSCWD